MLAKVLNNIFLLSGSSYSEAVGLTLRNLLCSGIGTARGCLASLAFSVWALTSVAAVFCPDSCIQHSNISKAQLEAV